MSDKPARPMLEWRQPETPEEQAVPQIRFATARLSTGVRVHYAEQGDVYGEPLVFLHGYADSWYSYSRILPLLPARYHAYALSQRGHGDSDRPADGYAVEDLAADVVAFLDAVGVPRATLIGDSSGAITTRRVAEQYPERVARLLLIAAPIRLPISEATLGLQEAIGALEDPVPPDFVRQFQPGTTYVPLPEAFAERVLAESLKLPARVWRLALDGLLEADDSDHLDRVAAPTLLIWGERDRFIPREEQAWLAGAIPHARLAVYPETGHAPHWERPERVVRDLGTFMPVT